MKALGQERGIALDPAQAAAERLAIRPGQGVHRVVEHVGAEPLAVLGEALHPVARRGDDPRGGAVEPELGVLGEALHDDDAQPSEAPRRARQRLTER